MCLCLHGSSSFEYILHKHSRAHHRTNPMIDHGCVPWKSAPQSCEVQPMWDGWGGCSQEEASVKAGNWQVRGLRHPQEPKRTHPPNQSHRARFQLRKGGLGRISYIVTIMKASLQNYSYQTPSWRGIKETRQAFSPRPRGPPHPPPSPVQDPPGGTP